MPRISTEEKIKQLEAKIASIKVKAERQKVRADPTIKHMKAGLKSIEQALGATSDAVLRKSLDEARETVSACLALCGVTARGPRGVVTPRPRGRPRAATTENGEATSSAPEASAVLGYLEKNPGSRSEHISGAYDTDAATLRPVLQDLIDGGKVRTEGEKRGRRYFASV